MSTRINKNITKKRMTVYLFLASLLFGFASCFLGHIIAAITAGLLAALWFIENGEKRVLSYISPLVIVLADFVVNGFGALFGIFSIVLGAMVLLSFKLKSKFTKCESVFAMTLVSAALITISLIVLGIQNEEGLSFAEYYQKNIEEYKQYFIEYFNEIYASAPEVNTVIALTDEQLESIFDSAINMLISMMVIYGFALSGVACKTFSLALSKNEDVKDELTKWRFFTPNVYAYFYVLIMFGSMFIGSADSDFAVTVLNLKNIFMFVFAYVGFYFLYRIASTKMKPFIAFSLILLVTLLFSSFAVSMLSLFGVFYTITINRYRSANSTGDGGPQS